MEKHILSKSTFIRGVQCLKSLYLYKHHPDQQDKLSAEQQAIFGRGNKVGTEAHKLFPGGIDVSATHKYHAAAEETKKLIRKGVNIIYEATFQFEGVLVMLDMLVNKNGKWIAYEVKSSAHISPTYVMDASVQYYVITNSGIELDEFYIVNINTDYVREGKLEVERLFAFTPVKKNILKNIPFVEESIKKQKETILEPSIPEVQISEHCFSPYKCSYQGLCWKDVPKTNSVFELGGIKKADQFKLYNTGYKYISDIPSELPLSKDVKLQVESLKQQAPIIDKEAIKKFVSSVNYPIHFMDFETFMPAIPIFNNTKAYEHTPFQYSIHLKDHKHATPKHIEFLADTGSDPRRKFIETLIEQTSRPGDIVVFGASFERSVLNNLKKHFPEYNEQIDYILYRIKDLLHPFENRHYYHYKMKGSNSLKQILPALVPELSYDMLTINSGISAMYIYEKLQTENDIMKISDMRDHLLEYCKLDTLAMVKIFEVLEGV